MHVEASGGLTRRRYAPVTPARRLDGPGRGFGVKCLGLRGWGLWFGVEGFRFEVGGLGLEVGGLGLRV